MYFEIYFRQSRAGGLLRKNGMDGGAGQSYPKKEDIDAGAGQPFPKKKKALPDEVYRALRGFFA